MQPLEELPPRQVPVLFNPCHAPLACRLELLTRGAPGDALHALPLWGPGKLDAQKGAAPPPTGMTPAAPQQMGLLRGHLAVEFLPSLRPHPGKPCGVVRVAEGADPVVRVAAQQGLPTTVGLDDFVTPAVPGIMPLHGCQDR